MNFVQSVTNIAKYSVASAVLAASMFSVAQAKEDNRDYVTGYIGYFDVIGNDDGATQFGFEYRARAIQYSIRPIFVVNVTTDESVYGYAGLNWDAELIENQLYLIPSFAAGLYRRGDGKDLGGAVEFRSGIELAYQFPNAHRLGAHFNHISNASIYKRNPGSETAMVTYSIPLDNFR